MLDHLTYVQIEKFYAGVLNSEETISAEAHLADCSSCRVLFHEIFQRIRDRALCSRSLSQTNLNESQFPSCPTQDRTITIDRICKQLETEIEK